MKCRYQYRIYPTPGQQISLAKLFGCCRVVWNDALALCKQSDSLPKTSDLQKVCITQAKKTVERRWLREVSNIPLQQSIADLGVAFKNFFDSLKGKRQGPKIKPPRFKGKDNQQSARLRKGGFSLKGEKVYLAKVANLKVRWSRPLPSEPSSGTVIKDRVGRYFLSFVVDVQPVSISAENQSVGVDLGIKTFAVLSSGQRIESLGYGRLDRKIRREQRKLNRRVKGSKRRERTRLRIAKLNAKQRDIRKDFLTSQTCADCGYHWGKLDLSVRELVCLGCGRTQGRDENASRNIERSGLELAHESKRTWSGHKTLSGAIRAEASTHRESI